jgi:NAD(P)-dependent dehydrogenase (short-subunit alcohol dehydrogenase family)
MRIVITGASSGLGKASAEHFAKESHELVLLARGMERLQQTAEELTAKYPNVQIEIHQVDISDLDQVRSFANNPTKQIDVLMNNAGLMGPDFSLSPQGIESQMATNHLGHFLLTNLLWNKLAKDTARVISLSSVVHRRSKLEANNKEESAGATGKYDRWGRYADSKLACLLFARELDLRAKQAGSKILSIAAHPGWALTGLQVNVPSTFDFLAQKAEVGARSQIQASLSPGFKGGEFIGPKFEAWGNPKLIEGSKHSRRLDVMQRLWEISEELTGESFQPSR